MFGTLTYHAVQPCRFSAPSLSYGQISFEHLNELNGRLNANDTALQRGSVAQIISAGSFVHLLLWGWNRILRRHGYA